MTKPLRTAGRNLLAARLDARGLDDPAHEARCWDAFALALDAAEDEALPVATAVTAERERVLAEVEALGSDSFDAYMTVAPMVRMRVVAELRLRALVARLRESS